MIGRAILAALLMTTANTAIAQANVVTAQADAAMAQERLAPIPEAGRSPEQQKAADAFQQARKTAPFGPFDVLLRSPDLMTAARMMGDHLRYKSAIGTQLSEFVILLNARAWDQDYEWSVHAPIAATQGIGATIIDAVAQGRRPDGMSADQALVYDFTMELQRNRGVSDATYAAARARFGEAGVVDLTGISGYYTMLAMVLNVARTPPVKGAPSLAPLLP